MLPARRENVNESMKCFKLFKTYNILCDMLINIYFGILKL